MICSLSIFCPMNTIFSMRSPYCSSQSLSNPGFLAHQFYHVFFGSGGIPLSGFSYFLLYTCLFKEEGHVAVVAEVADTLGADNAAGPFGSDIVVELMNVECRTAVVDKCANTVFFYFTSFVMVVMTFLVMMFAFMMMTLFMMVMRLFSPLRLLVALCHESIRRKLRHVQVKEWVWIILSRSTSA